MHDNNLVSVRFLTETQMMDFMRETKRGTGVFEKASTVIHDEFQKVRFGAGYADQELITVYWNIYDDRLFVDYKNKMAQQGRTPAVLHAGVRLTYCISENGKVTVSSFLRQGIRKVALGQKISLSCDSKPDIAVLECSLLQMLSKYKVDLTNLSDLTKRYISNPLTVMEVVMKKSEIPKSMRNKVIEMFASINGNALCSYYDVYLAINEILYIAQMRHYNGWIQAELEGKVAGCLRYDWKQFARTVMDAA